MEQVEQRGGGQAAAVARSGEVRQKLIPRQDALTAATAMGPLTLGDAVSEPGVRPIGRVLEDMGVVGAEDALLALYEQDLGSEHRLGEILVAHGVATREQVDAALAIQREELSSRCRGDEVAHPPSASDEDLRSAESRRVGNAGTRLVRNVQSVSMFVLAVVGVSVITVASGGAGSWYGAGALLLLAIKLTGSAIYRPVTSAVPQGIRVAVVVPFYNEDPEAFSRCLESIRSQTRAPDEIWAIDDGSKDSACRRIAESMLENVPGAVVHRLPGNRGKRHAQGYAFSRSRCDVFVTIDSDTVLDQAAIAEGLRPFADDNVQAVTGNVRALNDRSNLLTRLIDLRYANAFLYERAAYSTVGSVVCCCGSLSFYRADVIRRHLDDFLSQTFMGNQVQYGDDRRLTQYALLEGKVYVQDTAVAYTAVPDRLSHFRRQQLRWNKSFFRESLWAIRRFGPRRWPFWISLAEILVWLAFSASLIAVLYVRPLLYGEMIPWYYLAYAVVLAYARNVRYFGRPNASVGFQVATFALAPLYAVLHAMLLTPLRLWALLTLRQTGWGTRDRVEVAVKG